MIDIQHPKVAVRCGACAKIYTALNVDGEESSLLGRRDDCQCGATDFRLISATDE